jgi:hypothetical protein
VFVMLALLLSCVDGCFLSIFVMSKLVLFCYANSRLRFVLACFPCLMLVLACFFLLMLACLFCLYLLVFLVLIAAWFSRCLLSTLVPLMLACFSCLMLVLACFSYADACLVV